MFITKVSSLHIYPIKSTAGINLPDAMVDELGLAFDRRFVVNDALGQCITARTEPRLCLVRTKLTAHGIELSTDNMPTLTLTYEKFSNQYQNVTIWGDNIAGQLCSNEADIWFSEYLQRPCQLLFFGQNSSRKKKPNTERAREVAFADGYPLLLISQASLDNLNSRLEGRRLEGMHLEDKHLGDSQQQTVSMAQFRPNIVIDNCLPFAEDGWQHIRIGEVEFKVSKPCERCIMTTVNPKKAEKHPEQQPLRTLKSFRQTHKGEVLFGQNLIALNSGQIKAGDKVTVISHQEPPIFNLADATSPTQATLVNNASGNSNETENTMQLTCQQIITQTHDVKTFVLTWSGTSQIKQLAGQHINLLINMFGKEQPCCYTIASNPTTKNQISLTIKRVPKGKVSNFFHDHFKVGDTLKARAPSGNFHLPDVIPKKVLLLSAGSGITPMLSMLRFMVAEKTNNQIIFLHSARSEEDLIAREEIASLATAHGNCQVIYTLTRQVRPQWQDYQGHLSERMLTNITQLTQHEVFVCGPEGFRKAAQQYLRQLGLSKEQYHYESFGAKQTIAPSPTDNSVVAKAAYSKLNIHFDKWQKHYQGDNQKTLLEHGEDAGLILPYSCRAGMCGSCKAQLISGEVMQTATDGLTDQEKQTGYILCCSATATSDVVIKHG